MDFLNNNFDTEEITLIGIEYGIKIVAALALFFIGKILARFSANFLKKSLTDAKLDPILVSFLGNISYFLLLSFVIIAVLAQLGIETTSIAAIFAAAGLAIGLALQSSLSNFAAGIMIVGFKPFKIGNFIEIGSASGTVKDINIFTTTLKTGDNKTVIVPNGTIMSGTITNYSAEETRRVDLVFSCSYSDDISAVKKLLEKITTEDSRILKDPAPKIVVSELADSSVNFIVRPWVKTEDYWSVYWDLTEKVKLEFDKQNISIPYPQQDVHLYKV